MPPPGLQDAWRISSSAADIPLGVDLERSVRHHRTVRRVLRFSIEAALLVVLGSLLFFRFPQVEGQSMEPMISAGNHVLINTLAYDIGLGSIRWPRTVPQRGDVVAFVREQDDGRKIYLKRVVALPGERIALENGLVIIDGRALRDDQHVSRDVSNMGEVLVPAGSIFVLGDNRAQSDDSRTFGPVPRSAVVGKALFLIWPPNRMHSIN